MSSMPSQRLIMGVAGVVLLVSLLQGFSEWSRQNPAEGYEDFADVEGASEGTPFSLGAAICKLGALQTLALLTVLIFNQRNYIYKPVPSGGSRTSTGKFADPARWGLTHHDVVVRSSDGTRLHAWLLHKDGLTGKRATVLFFHSNAGDIVQRLPFFSKICNRLGVVVLAMEYRGFGLSEDGDGFSEEAFLRDALATYEWLQGYAVDEETLADPKRLFVMGRSLGGCVSAKLLAHLLGAEPTARRPAEASTARPSERLPLPAGIAFENVPTSIADVARHLLPPLKLLPDAFLSWPLLRDEWRTADWLDWAGRVLKASNRAGDIRLCLLSSAKDAVVPPWQMLRLRAVAEETSEAWSSVDFHLFPNAGHMDAFDRGGQKYVEALRSFFGSEPSSE